MLIISNNTSKSNNKNNNNNNNGFLCGRTLYVRFAKTLWQDYTGCSLAFLTVRCVCGSVYALSYCREVGHGSRHLMLCANLSDLSDMACVLDVF